MNTFSLIPLPLKLTKSHGSNKVFYPIFTMTSQFDTSSAVNPDKMGIFRTKFVHFRTTNNPLNVKG
ncbi:MAG: hypothetical protein PWP66_556 [Thermosediminibacterales bacterium]|nr:hypothetical protein [Thermosediminibacterales bacterium]